MSLINVRNRWLRRAAVVAIAVPFVLLVTAVGAVEGGVEQWREATHALRGAWRGRNTL